MEQELAHVWSILSLRRRMNTKAKALVGMDD